MFGLFERLSRKGRRRARALKKEHQGDLQAAVALYLEAELPGEAARVLLLRAAAETSPEKRLATLARAAQVGASSEAGREAGQRKAVLAFDLLRANRGSAMRGELLGAAAELERVECFEQAAEAYRLAEDGDAEVRMLQAAGNIDKLEQRLQQSSQQARATRERKRILQLLRDSDAFAERRNGLEQAQLWLRNNDDADVRGAAERIRNRLLRGPDIHLEVHGQRGRYLLGSNLTIGRAGADVLVPSNSISRQHLRIFREAGAVFVEDMATRNGTLLAGARLSAPLQLHELLELSLAGRVSCRIEQHDGIVAVTVAGERYLLPLGPLRIGSWEITDAHDGDDCFVVLRTDDGATPPHTAQYRLAQRIELCHGDQLHGERGGPVVLGVPQQPHGTTP